MKAQVDLNSVYAPSEDVAVREIEGEFVIIPIASGIGNAEEDIFSLNKTGGAIWDKLDGKRSLNNIARGLSEEFKAPLAEIEKDCLGLVDELLKRKIVVKV